MSGWEVEGLNKSEILGLEVHGEEHVLEALILFF